MTSVVSCEREAAAEQQSQFALLAVPCATGAPGRRAAFTPSRNDNTAAATTCAHGRHGECCNDHTDRGRLQAARRRRRRRPSARVRGPPGAGSSGANPALSDRDHRHLDHGQQHIPGNTHR